MVDPVCLRLVQERKWVGEGGEGGGVVFCGDAGTCIMYGMDAYKANNSNVPWQSSYGVCILKDFGDHGWMTHVQWLL